MRWMLFFCLIATAMPAAATEQEAIAEADRLYGLRGSSDQAEEAVEYLKTATADYPDSYELHWRLARACWWVADGTTD